MSPKVSPFYVLMGLFVSVPGCHPTTGPQEKPEAFCTRETEVHWGQHFLLGHTELGETSHSRWLTVLSLMLFASCPRACPLCARCPSCSTGLPLLLWEGKCFPFPLPFCSPAASESGFPFTLPPSASGTTGKCIKGLGKAAVRG